MHDNELLRISLLQEIMLLVAHAAAFPGLQAVCSTPLQRIRRSVRYCWLPIFVLGDWDWDWD